MTESMIRRKIKELNKKLWLIKDENKVQKILFEIEDLVLELEKITGEEVDELIELL